MFKFYLDNIQVRDALNWFDFTETIERDAVIKGLLPKYDVKLNFNADGYKYLYDSMQTNGYCKLVELKVDYKCDGGYSTILNGYILLSDCKFNLNKCTVECSVMDNNYGARIYNNKNIKAYLHVGKSKNDVDITPCDYDDIQMFTPSTGVYNSVTTRKAYNIADAFRFLIDFMCDGTIGFESDYLTTITDDYGIEGLRITTGNEIRLATGTSNPFVSFQDLFQEVDKKYPLGFTIIDVGGLPTIKIEDAAYFYKPANSITINAIEDLNQSFNNELLYSSIKLGDVNAVDIDGTHSFAQIRFFNFLPEQYHLQGECNIDKILDLTGIFIYDTNIIEAVFVTDNTNDEFDDNIFFIQTYDDSGTRKATQTVDPTSGTVPYYYNSNLKNNEVASRYNLQGNIALYLGSNNDLFLAGNNAIQDMSTEFATFPSGVNNISSIIFFQDDSTPPNFDTNGRYNNTTYRYTSPANGVYSFNSNVISIFNGTGSTNLRVVFNVYNASNVLQNNFYGPLYVFNLGNGTTYYNTPLYGSMTSYLPSGYYVTVSIDEFIPANGFGYQFFSFNVQLGSYFECGASINGGGVYEPKNPSDYFVSRFEFQKALSFSDYSTLKLDLSKSIIINNGSQENKTVWMRKSIRKVATGETTWELISNIDNSN